MELDRNRPFGTLYPPLDGARFVQDGTYFDSKGLSLSPVEVIEETDEPADIKDLDLDSLTKRQLEQLARDAFGVELDRRQRLDDLRAQVRALIGA
jgi:hypothetical protein